MSTANFYNRVYNDITDPSYLKKKQYDDNVYVVFSTDNFVIGRNSTSPSFICFIKQKGEQFGDSLPVENPLSYNIRIYDKAGNVIVNGNLVSTDVYLGQYEYTFNILDLDKIGHFDGEIIEINSNVENVLGKFKINVI